MASERPSRAFWRVLGDRFRMKFRLRCRADTGDGPELDLDPQVHDIVAALGGCVADEGLSSSLQPGGPYDCGTRVVAA